MCIMYNYIVYMYNIYYKALNGMLSNLQGKMDTMLNLLTALIAKISNIG